MNNSHFLSIDLEDWHTSAFLKNYVNTSNLVHRIEQTTYPILQILEKHNTQATFFILGSVAKSHPRLIKDIHKHGHEIASHGYSHKPLWELSPIVFQEEIQTTNKLLNDICGEKILGFRAPYASLNQNTSWALDILISEGFLYDSSIFPMKTPLYGVQNAPKDRYTINSKNILENAENGLIEIPFSVFNFSCINIPCTGGIYGRFLPSPLLKGLLNKIQKKRKINFYFHPWETEIYLNDLDIPFTNKIISYYNSANYLDKIENIIKSYNFSTFKNILNLHLN